ncbi:metallopeptidase [Hoyosella sp. YIM 151337]|uniref:metallopeptidase n=1 Tax=Hoyosella sp. YIM 151337 TaxID=2992742 RepID=UPI0022358827|nr:metallopeptidase [Hoyosella sp. YIM 151337]MCW4354603.1 metallopeptidase [Hoyosella sp. YIM 151337]
MTARLQQLGVLFAAGSVLLTGCAPTGGEASETIAGLEVRDGPSGVREDAPPPTARAYGGATSQPDTVALHAISDLNEFWRENIRLVADRPFSEVSRLLSWDATADVRDAGVFCHATTAGLENAAYCPEDNSIGWDRDILLPYVAEHFGDIGIATVMAHEFGHAVSFHTHASHDPAGLTGDALLLWEQQADCYAGVYLRHVAEGASPRFTLSTTDGIRSVLAAMVAIRDHDVTAFASGHGSGLDRVTALQLGFTEGAPRCAALDGTELHARSPVVQDFAGPHDTGELPVNQGTVSLVAESFAAAFGTQATPVVLSESGGAFCGAEERSAGPAIPAKYCRDTRSLAISLHELASRGRVERSPGPFPAAVRGDFSAFGIVASRLALALRDDAGLPLDGAEAAWAAACYTGAWARSTAQTDSGRIFLSPGDLDEALSELVTGDLIASDGSAEPLRSAFARVDAYRSGLTGGPDAC